MSDHYYWGNGCHCKVLLDTESLSVKRETMPPNTKEIMHFHEQATQVFYIESGRATFYLDGQKTVVNNGEHLVIGRNVRHFIENEFADMLEFIVISQPSTTNDRIEIQQDEV